jgi:hypothetical protein
MFGVGAYNNTFTISAQIKIFFICQTFEKLFITCAKILIKY